MLKIKTRESIKPKAVDKTELAKMYLKRKLAKDRIKAMYQRKVKSKELTKQAEQYAPYDRVEEQTEKPQTYAEERLETAACDVARTAKTSAKGAVRKATSKSISATKEQKTDKITEKVLEERMTEQGRRLAVNKARKVRVRQTEELAGRKQWGNAIKTGTKNSDSTLKNAVYQEVKTVRMREFIRERMGDSIKFSGKGAVRVVRELLVEAAGRRLAFSLGAGVFGMLLLVLVVLICALGLFCGSSYGIFFSGEDSGSGVTMQTAVQEINAEYYGKLNSIQDSHAHDLLRISGTPADWIDVLAVYAVKVSAAEDGQDVATMDNGKKELLRRVFWDMTHVNWGIVEVSDTSTLLWIEISHKSPGDMADDYGFDRDGRRQLAELLDEKWHEQWATVLYGIGAGGGDIVNVAMSQIGNIGGEIYWRWYGYENRVNWCACFVSWCAEQCGYIENGAVPKFANCAWAVNWFKQNGLWQEQDFNPRVGDIIFFDWDDEDGQDSIADHTGIVQKVSDGLVYVIEGNAADECRLKSYTLGEYEILGYGVPRY